ncbi:MAG TPA: HIT family protein [Candidatus Woesebacteria bacterium]|nr:HIT family protein [Candidatus Woesebacteria bacterium]
MKEDCIFCTKKTSHLLIKEYTYWTVYLNINQSYLGWCEVVLKDHKEDMFDCTEKELKELFTVVNNLRQVTKQLFSPDMFNYSSLGNQVKHVHLHFIPRYSSPVTFSDHEFHDDRWGKNYSPYNKDITFDNEVLKKIAGSLTNSLI